MIVGSKELLEKYGSPLDVAIALLDGKLSAHEQKYVDDVVTPMVLEAAKYKLERRPPSNCGHCGRPIGTPGLGHCWLEPACFHKPQEKVG